MKKIIAFLLILTICSLVACNNAQDKADGDTNKNTTPVTKYSEEFVLEKIGELNYENLLLSNKVFTVKDSSGKYAIISIDGKNKTDFKYSNVKSGIGYGYSEVTTATAMDANDINSLNACGIVNKDAEEVLPCEYALINPLSERYIYVAKITGATESKEESLIYYSADSFLVNAFSGSDDDDLRFKGVWQIYDAEKKQMVKGATGTKPSSPSACGDFIKYTDDNGDKVCLDANGNEWDSKTVSPNGAYHIKKDDNITYYSANGDELITVKTDDYYSIVVQDDCLVAIKNTDNGSLKYVVLDMQGNEISAEFENNITVYKHFIECEDYIYNYDGKKIIDKKYTYVDFDEVTENFYYLNKYSDDGELTVIDKDGNILYTAAYKNSDNIKSSGSFFLFYEEKESNIFTYYSYKSQSFKFENAFSVGPFMVSALDKEKQTRTLINVLTDTEMLEGYRKYQCAIDQDNTVYVYATTEDNNVDIYVLK